jgi:alpha-beta hydrolase superfamily lysophospholipase
MKRIHNNRLKSFIKIFLIFFALAIAGFIYFCYVFLPERVAEDIVTKAKTRSAIHLTPQEDGFPYQDISFSTSEGITLSGWWIGVPKPRKPTGTVILSHGVFKNREQVLNRAEFLVKAGYQVLLFDHRGEGLSGESPVSGGVLEAGDYLAAVNYLKANHHLEKPLAFLGFSLGAISAIRAASQCPEVDAVIADSPLPNVKAYVSRRSWGGALSRLPGFFDRCLEDYDRLTGLSLKPSDLDLEPIIRHFGEKPILYITGEADDLARSSEVRALFNETQSHHRSLAYIPEAGHEQTYLLYPMVYEQAVLSFLTEVRENFPAPNEAELLKKVKKNQTPIVFRDAGAFLKSTAYSTQPIK